VTGDESRGGGTTYTTGDHRVNIVFAIKRETTAMATWTETMEERQEGPRDPSRDKIF